MSPAKATRPGFRHSMAVTAADSEKTDSRPDHLFHPVYHTFATPIRSRIDVDRTWPVRLEDADPEELVDVFSEPPQFAERLSPVSVQFGDAVIKGHNWTEVRVKLLRNALDLFARISAAVESGPPGAVKTPFASFSLDPDTIHRVIELDYESGESTYQQLMALFSEGILTPAITTPFQSLLPLHSETEIRLIGRIAFTFYHRVVLKHRSALERRGEDALAILPIWLPETACSRRVLEILAEEFREYCRREKLGRPHPVFLLDSDQAEGREHDVLMKSWNVLNGNGFAAADVRAATANGANSNGSNGAHANGAAHAVERAAVPVGANGPRRAPKTAAPPAPVQIHPAADGISVVFRDRSFSDWVAYTNPSVKKLLDRTIAKVDSDLNQKNVHYGWGHFEDLDALVWNSKSLTNYKQKLVKLAELGYLPLSPDQYVRGKLCGRLRPQDHEPRPVEVRDGTAGGDWNVEHRMFGRWLGVKPGPEGPVVADARRYPRPGPEGQAAEEEAPQCWKIAWDRTRRVLLDQVVGDLETLHGGMAEVLSDLVGGPAGKRRHENVMSFLVAYTHVYWREHFIQHDLSEADINVHELANQHLRAGLKPNLTERDAAIAGAAARAIFFAFDSGRAAGTRPEHMDQRAFYQNVAMLTLAACDAVHVRTWQKDAKSARRLVDLIRSELIGFENAWERHDLASLGVKKKCWEKALESQIEESRHNVVRRAATRVAANQLRPLGFVKDFSREDELATTNVGHLWADEIANPSFKYENPVFCGVREV